MEELLAAGFRGAAFVLPVLRTFVRYTFFREAEAALEAAESGGQYVDGAIATYHQIGWHQYRALSAVAAHGADGVDAARESLDCAPQVGVVLGGEPRLPGRLGRSGARAGGAARRRRHPPVRGRPRARPEQCLSPRGGAGKRAFRALRHRARHQDGGPRLSDGGTHGRRRVGRHRESRTTRRRARFGDESAGPAAEPRATAAEPSRRRPILGTSPRARHSPPVLPSHQPLGDRGSLGEGITSRRPSTSALRRMASEVLGLWRLAEAR